MSNETWFDSKISTHTSRVGCDDCGGNNLRGQQKFLLTHPVWDVTRRRPQRHQAGIEFLLTHPVWDVTEFYAVYKGVEFISTHTSRVGCDAIIEHESGYEFDISTHTSRVGCDLFSHRTAPSSFSISTHTSRVGCDRMTRSEKKAVIFLLTHPVWDVTVLSEDSHII